MWTRLPLLVILICWLSVLFVSFGLFAPRNPTVISVLFVCACSMSAAVFLILELNRPLDGFINVSRAPLRNALAHTLCEVLGGTHPAQLRCAAGGRPPQSAIRNPQSATVWQCRP